MTRSMVVALQDPVTLPKLESFTFRGYDERSQTGRTCPSVHLPALRHLICAQSLTTNDFNFVARHLETADLSPASFDALTNCVNLRKFTCNVTPGMSINRGFSLRLPQLEKLELCFFELYWQAVSHVSHAMASCTPSRLVLTIATAE